MENKKVEISSDDAVIMGSGVGLLFGAAVGTWFTVLGTCSAGTIKASLATCAVVGLGVGLGQCREYATNKLKYVSSSVAGAALAGVFMPAVLAGTDHAYLASSEPTPHVQTIQLADKAPVDTLTIYKPA